MILTYGIALSPSFLQLPRSGWSVGRAGQGTKATYPALFVIGVSFAFTLFVVCLWRIWEVNDIDVWHRFESLVSLTTVQRLVCWQGRVGSQSDLPCLNGAPNPTRPQVLVFFFWFVCIKEARCSRTKLTALKGFMVSNGSYNNRTRRKTLHPIFTYKRIKRKKTKTYGLVFSRRSLGRVGRSRSQPCPTKRPTATRQLAK